uniref:SUN domain-containing protein n=1 Tax=Angiostrongylus cantonensis TaxID=6313 RepID=A0A0K0D2H4_ANGCA
MQYFCRSFRFSRIRKVCRPTTSVLLSGTADGECFNRKLPEESHPPIATFDEWTKEKLNVLFQSTSPLSEVGLPSVGSQQLPPSSAATRNYASKECGAKVLHSNAEAENTKAILNEKVCEDEYMRNPCENAAYKFVIIELCETVQLRAIELANYELFSSGPRTIRLWSAERFPTGEWQLITELTAIDSRQIQQFSISSNGVYVKFMKVELLSHYGNEHYCTLSVLKVLGISMIDEYEAEVSAYAAIVSSNKFCSHTYCDMLLFNFQAEAASESVFMKLNKRIAALELNMSLSSEYLSELSRQYVAQSDEHQRRMRQVREIVDEAAEAVYARVNETLANKVGNCISIQYSAFFFLNN